MGIKQIKQIALRFREYTSFRFFFFFVPLSVGGKYKYR